LNAAAPSCCRWLLPLRHHQLLLLLIPAVLLHRVLLLPAAL
jgi:hypothetical protein